MKPEDHPLVNQSIVDDMRDYMDRARAVNIEVLGEILEARTNWPPFNSAHEGFAILNEEFDELKEHVWTNQKRRDLHAMRKEAIQLAAMAIRMAIEVCDERRGRV